MRTKTILSFVVAIMIAMFALSFAMASIETIPVSIDKVIVNDVELFEGSLTSLAASPGETVPIRVTFTANEDLLDVRVKVWVGDRDSVSTARFDVLDGSVYIKKLSLTLPNVYDMDDVNESWTLHVQIINKDGDNSTAYQVEMQRESYDYDILSVDAPSRAKAGEVIGVDVVLKNTGFRELQDSFVIVAIPELGVAKKAYFGDLDSTDDCEDDCDKEDARERRVYLVLPSDAKSGDYTLEVKASNYETSSVVKRLLVVSGTSGNATSTGTGNAITITGGNTKLPTSVVVLTVILVVIFVVLLIVLIVLLTKKPSEKTEDFGETSYY